MDLTVSVTVGDEDWARLQDTLGYEDDALNGLVELIGKAGANEFIAQSAGRQVPSTLADVRAYRVYRLLEAGVSLKDAEALVPILFKVEPPIARRLLERTLARYDFELAEAISQRVQSVLDSALWDGSRWQVGVPLGPVRERVIEEVSQLAEPDPETSGRGQLWLFPDETYQAIRSAFHLDPRPKPAKAQV